MAAAAATGGGIYELEALGPLASKLPMPPQAPLLGSEKGSFAEGTITKRLPAILASTLSDFEASMAQLFAADAEGAAQVRRGSQGMPWGHMKTLTSYPLPEPRLPSPSSPGSTPYHQFVFCLRGAQQLQASQACGRRS